MMSAKMSCDPHYLHHILLNYLRWATFELRLKVTAFIILENSKVFKFKRIASGKNVTKNVRN